MKNKKYTLPVIIALMLVLCAITVFATTTKVDDKSVNDRHDYHSVCNVDGCTEITEHEHHTAASNNNGAIFGLCNVSGCNTASEHQHGDEHYSGHSANDGHDYHAVCNIDGCTEITEHEHHTATSRNENTHHNSEHKRGEHH